MVLELLRDDMWGGLSMIVTLLLAAVTVFLQRRKDQQRLRVMRSIRVMRERSSGIYERACSRPILSPKPSFVKLALNPSAWVSNEQRVDRGTKKVTVDRRAARVQSYVKVRAGQRAFDV